jgi:hypothetical protein
MVDRKLLAGVPTEFENAALFAFTEHNTREQIDHLIDALAEVAA